MTLDYSVFLAASAALLGYLIVKVACRAYRAHHESATRRALLFRRMERD